MTGTRSSTLTRAPRPSGLADVLDLILDKGLVIDAYVRVSLVGIEVLTVDARIVVASVDTYLRFAEAVNRLDLRSTETDGFTGLLGNDDSEDGDRGGSGGSGSRAPAPRGSTGGREQSRVGRAREGLRRGDQEGDGGRGSRQPAGLVRRLAERGRWEE